MNGVFGGLAVVLALFFLPVVVGLMSGSAAKGPGFSWRVFWKGFAITIGVQVLLGLIAIGLCSGGGGG